MKRKIMEKLAAWKNKKDRMPLILDGARQVGKTYSALEFGRSRYANTAYFNFENSPGLGKIFDGELEPEKIIRDLEILSLQKITPEDTLVIFDEIQCSERALTSLKYFCEQAPQYHIVAAGSLLGVTLNRSRYSFPVGKTERLAMHPMDFEEFMWALGMDGLAEAIRESFASSAPLATHERALETLKKYIVTGGMPKAVAEYAMREDFNYVTAVQKSLANDYVADMAKYATPQDTARIIAAWNSVPAQLAKENHKFQYKLIKRGARSAEYETAITWLESSGIIHRCVRTAQGELPLVFQQNLLNDSGLPEILLGGVAVGAHNVHADFRAARAAEYGAVLHQGHPHPLTGRGDGGAHPRESAADDYHVKADRLFMDRHC